MEQLAPGQGRPRGSGFKAEAAAGPRYRHPRLPKPDPILLPDDLIDEYRLLIYPIALGRGKHLFDEKSQAKLSFAESKAFGTGVVKLVYRRADKTQD